MTVFPCIFLVMLYTVLPSVNITNVTGLHTHTHTHKHIYTQCTILNDTGWESVMLSGKREGSKRLAVEHSLYRCSCAG